LPCRSTGDKYDGLMMSPRPYGRGSQDRPKAGETTMNPGVMRSSSHDTWANPGGLLPIAQHDWATTDGCW